MSKNVSPSVLITGSSTGIGWACALEMDRRGWRVFAGVRGDDAAGRLRAEGSERLIPLRIDVTEADSIAAAARLIDETVGSAGLDGLVNNAGIAVPGPLEAVPITALRRQLEVNVIGHAAVTQAMLPMLRRARGRVVNISSVSGGLAAPYLGAYAASKFALEAINDSLRQELRRWGIRVCSVAPGAIGTPIWEKSAASGLQLAQDVSPEVLKLYENELQAMQMFVAQSLRTASPVSRVVRAVVHALSARRPKTHYYLGWTTRICFKSMKLLSDPVRDWIVRKLLGLP